jgi:AGZA family xanthine/uracil permease-like MFS transporter
VGALLMDHLALVEWKSKRHALPAFMACVLMPLTYSIANGVIGGVATFIALEAGHWLLDRFGGRRGA